MTSTGAYSGYSQRRRSAPKRNDIYEEESVHEYHSASVSHTRTKRARTLNKTFKLLPTSDQFDRAGKWTAEEEAFANRLVENFMAGSLRDCEENTTLRSYLARKLNCSPMRISKKYAGQCIGKSMYVSQVPKSHRTSSSVPSSSSSAPSSSAPSLESLHRNYVKSLRGGRGAFSSSDEYYYSGGHDEEQEREQDDGDAEGREEGEAEEDEGSARSQIDSLDEMTAVAVHPKIKSSTRNARKTSRQRQTGSVTAKKAAKAAKAGSVDTSTSGTVTVDRSSPHTSDESSDGHHVSSATAGANNNAPLFTQLRTTPSFGSFARIDSGLFDPEGFDFQFEPVDDNNNASMHYANLATSASTSSLAEWVHAFEGSKGGNNSGLAMQRIMSTNSLQAF